MPMSLLLWHALETSDTSFWEQGKGATLRREAGETVLVFRLDKDEIRRQLRIDRVCDALFFYKKPPARPLLLFVELKGNDVEHGVDQLRQTLTALRSRLQQALGPQAPSPAELRAVLVCSRVASPHETKRLREGFQRATGVALKVETVARNGTCDLRRFLS